MIFKHLLLFLFLKFTLGVNFKVEDNLRSSIFENYNKNNRPIINSSDTVKLKYGIEIKSLEYLDQKAENVEYNIWIIQTWKDEYLTWNTSIYNLSKITTNADTIWTPDLELYNSASKPKVYDKYGGIKIFSDGTVLWIRPTTFSFSCHLNFQKFPFDTQSCTMTFGSWKYPKHILDVKPFGDTDIYLNISIDPTFSHNEWIITKTSVTHEDIEYLCCPDELYPNSFYTITMKRNYTKYMIVITLTLLITISAMIVLLIPIQNYIRTYVLVFIPLTIIWLQIYIASKIPVIEYYTSMEKIILSCFFFTLCGSYESGILYCLLYENFTFLSIILKQNYNFYTDNSIQLKNKKMIIYKNEINNKNSYKNLESNVVFFDNIYRGCLYISFIITITYFLANN